MKEFLVAHAVEVGIMITAITAVGVFVGPLLAGWRQRKNAEQDRRLKTHFEELKEEAEPVRSFHPSEHYGKIAGVELTPQISTSLEAHFPGQSEQWKRWEATANAHNKNYETFRQKIKTDFEKKGIPVEKYPAKDFCCIYEDAFDALFNMWRELAQNKPPWPDFQQINSEQADGGYFLRAQKWASALAFAKTEDEQQKCSAVLAEIAYDIGNQGEAAKILDSANKLVEKAREFANQFAAKLDEIDKYWPGKKPSKFKRLKKTCQTCKEL